MRGRLRSYRDQVVVITGGSGGIGRTDVWVNNVAVMCYGRFEDTPPEVHRAVLEADLLGPIHGSRAW